MARVGVGELRTPALRDTQSWKLRLVLGQKRVVDTPFCFLMKKYTQQPKWVIGAVPLLPAINSSCHSPFLINKNPLSTSDSTEILQLQRAWATSSSTWPRRSSGHPVSPEDAKPMQRPQLLFRTGRSHPHSKWGKALDTMEATVALEENMNQAVWDMHALGSSCIDPYFCDLLASPVLDEQVKLTRKMVILWLPCTGWWPQLKRGEDLFQRLTLKQG